MKTLNRNQFIAMKIGKLNNEIVLDIGCRDKIFKKYLIKEVINMLVLIIILKMKIQTL